MIELLAASDDENIPVIDLHAAETTHDALDQLESGLFLFSQKKEPYCRVVHGIGGGILKEAVHTALKESPLVKDFCLSFDGGSTMVGFYDE
ncbi:MAG: hypothetical protein A3C10_01385 [Candidatus Magasanikbacteria bacterium RIFCSPHIGHO2_02_FULL_48_18]|nr:MAG: hypothetical protein A3I74_02020 [Candidatus Magasanikbacteria bacterium RIFCSPLOWO2_02_FULL_47_16]OGH79707.1 MAG: hypothetical protein A3C10_01385 [Candidatus Magasanikbacteria bacterium RIFCSPHIGHO2_02_FULL_48_18]